MTASGSPGGAEVAGAVEFLMRRMQRSNDFPALSETVRTLNRLSASDEKSMEHLAAVIVRDYALTNKVLKVVNSAFYGGFAGKVGTISRALVVLGLKPIRALAASLILFEQFAGEENAERVKALIGKSMFSALLAREAAAEIGSVHGEEAFLAAMFHNLGDVLVAFYLPEEDRAIEAEMEKDGISAAQAQYRILGVDHEHLGMAVGKSWNFPHAITYSMKALPAGKLSASANDEDALRQLAGLAHEMTDCLAAGCGPDHPDVLAVLARYPQCAGLDGRQISEIVQATRSEYRVLAEGLAMPASAPASIRALSTRQEAAEREPEADDEIAAVTLPDDGPDADRCCGHDPEPILSEGLQEATSMLSENADLNQIAKVVLESVYRAFGLRRVALCLRDPVRQRYVGRLGFGEDIDGYLEALHFDAAYKRDAFHVALRQQTDVHIADLAVYGSGQSIPAWYRALTPNGAMLFLPIVVQNRPIGCIVAEHQHTDGILLEAGALRLVRALRNQLALAMQLRH